MAKRYLLLSDHSIVDTYLGFEAQHHGKKTGVVIIGIDTAECRENNIYYYYESDKLMQITADELNDNYLSDAIEVKVIRSSDNLFDLKEIGDIVVVRFDDSFINELERPVYACSIEEYERPLKLLKKQESGNFKTYLEDKVMTITFENAKKSIMIDVEGLKNNTNSNIRQTITSLLQDALQESGNADGDRGSIIVNGKKLEH